MALNRDKVLATKNRLKTAEVHVPEWADDDGDDVVIVRELTGAEMDAFDTSLTVRRPKFGDDRGAAVEMEEVPNHGNITARFVALAVVDEDGKRLFSEGDAIALGELSGAALNRVYAKASELSRVRDIDAVEAEGNSEAGPSVGSTSESPETSE